MLFLHQRVSLEVISIFICCGFITQVAMVAKDFTTYFAFLFVEVLLPGAVNFRLGSRCWYSGLYTQR